MPKFKKGDKIRRVRGSNNVTHNMVMNHLYTVERFNNDGDLVLEENDGVWYEDNFELVKYHNIDHNDLSEYKHLFNTEGR